MKKKLLSIFAVFFTLTILLTGCSKNHSKEDNSLQEIKKRGEFIVGLDDTFAPMGFRDEKGEIVGLDIDLAKEVGKRMGVKVVFKPVDWNGIIGSLNNGDVDVIWNGLSISEQRKQQISFSKEYLKDGQAILVRSSDSISSKKDLAGKVIGTQLGSTSEDAINAEPEVMKTFKDIKRYANFAEALMDLGNGRVDAVVIDETVGRYYMTKKPGAFKVLKDNFGQQAVGVGIRKTDESFKKEIDRILDEMKADGTTAEISKKWLGEDLIIK